MNLPEPGDIRRIAILGGGTIGSSWTAYFLSRGFEVTVTDPAADGEARTRRYIENAWPALQRLGMAESASPDRWRFTADPAEAVRGAQFVQENAPERLEVKQELFARVESALSPDANVATSTSGLLISDIQQGRVGPERYVVGHPFNPPHLIPLVEVVGGRQTDPAVVDWTLAFYNSIGKKAIRINKEVRGHLVNRLQSALWREAVHAVADGIASVEDVDTGIAYGPGLRWAIFGPHMVFTLAGGEGGMRHFLDHLGAPNEDWWRELGTPSLTPEVRQAVIDGVDAETAGRPIQDIMAERDALLIALLETLGEKRRELKGGG